MPWLLDDLLADVHRRAVVIEGLFDGLDGPVDACAVPTRLGEQHTLRRGAERRRGVFGVHGLDGGGCIHNTDGTDRGVRPTAPMGQGEVMHLPSPMRAAVGLAVTAADEARRLPDRAIELPMLAVSTALQASLRLQQRYARLAARGDEILNRKPVTDSPPDWATFDEPVDLGAGRRRPSAFDTAVDDVDFTDSVDGADETDASGPTG